MTIKYARTTLPDPNQTSGANWTVSCIITRHLIAALRRTAEFWSGYYALLIGEGRYEIFLRHAEDADTALGEDQDATST